MVSIFSYIGLYVSVKVSFNFMFCLVISYMWHISYLFKFDFSFQYVGFHFLFLSCRIRALFRLYVGQTQSTVRCFYVFLYVLYILF
jgi:hypothetical protein